MWENYYKVTFPCFIFFVDESMFNQGSRQQETTSNSNSEVQSTSFKLLQKALVSDKEEEEIIKLELRRKKIQDELDGLREKEREQKEKIAEENKKRELRQQIQNELDRIKKAQSSQGDGEDETPGWVKMVMDPNERKLYLEKKKSESRKQSVMPKSIQPR